MAIVHVDEKSFGEEVLKSKMPVVVDFYADWCGPCRMMGPIFEEVSNEFDSKVKFAKLDVDENQKISEKYGVMSIPTLIIFKAGKEVETMTGLLDKKSLVEAAKKVS